MAGRSDTLAVGHFRINRVIQLVNTSFELTSTTWLPPICSFGVLFSAPLVSSPKLGLLDLTQQLKPRTLHFERLPHFFRARSGRVYMELICVVSFVH